MPEQNGPEMPEIPEIPEMPEQNEPEMAEMTDADLEVFMQALFGAAKANADGTKTWAEPKLGGESTEVGRDLPISVDNFDSIESFYSVGKAGDEDETEYLVIRMVDQKADTAVALYFSKEMWESVVQLTTATITTRAKEKQQEIQLGRLQALKDRLERGK